MRTWPNDMNLGIVYSIASEGPNERRTNDVGLNWIEAFSVWSLNYFWVIVSKSVHYLSWLSGDIIVGIAETGSNYCGGGDSDYMVSLGPELLLQYYL